MFLSSLFGPQLVPNRSQRIGVFYHESAPLEGKPLPQRLNEGAHFSHKEVNNMKVNMKLPKNLGMLLLGIWLIVTGLLQVVSIHIPAIGIILALLAIAAGVLILLGR